MNTTALATWNGAGGSPSGLSLLPLTGEEFRRNKTAAIGMFTVIALGALALGLFMPKQYTSSATILVEEGNIIGPLMEGRAVPTGVTNRASIAREVAFSRKVMQDMHQCAQRHESELDAIVGPRDRANFLKILRKITAAAPQ